MTSFEFSPAAQQWCDSALMWIGLGALAAILARVLLPVRRPTSPTGTLVVGIAGSALGLWAAMSLRHGSAFRPTGPLGIAASIGGAFTLLLLVQVAAALWPRGAPRNAKAS